MKLSNLGKFLLHFFVISLWLNFCGAIIQLRLYYERSGQINVFFGKKRMEIKKENTRAENERKTNGRNRRNGRKVESNNKQKLRKRKKKFQLDSRK